MVLQDSGTASCQSLFVGEPRLSMNRQDRQEASHKAWMHHILAAYNQNPAKPRDAKRIERGTSNPTRNTHTAIILPNQSAELGALHSCSGGRSLLTGSRGGSPDGPRVRVVRIAVRTIKHLSRFKCLCWKFSKF